MKSNTTLRRPRDRQRIWPLLGFIFLGAIGSLGFDDANPYGRTVAEVVIEGNETVSDARIRAKLRTRPGRPLDPDLVDADFRALHQMKLFSHVGATFRDAEDGERIILVIKVQEMPTIESVEFRGNHSIRDGKLAEITGLKDASRADMIRARSSLESIRRLYEENGFLLAEVELVEGGKIGDRQIVFEIFEGPRFQVNQVRFEGNAIFSDATLLTKIRTKKRILGIFGERYTKEGPEADARRIMEAYQAIGYFDCNCTPVVRHDDRLGDLELTYVISEGPLYRVRNISFEGLEKIAEEELRPELKLHSGEALTDALRQHDVMKITEKYSAIGCIDMAIQPEPRFTDEPGVVDLVYRIDEGESYLMGRINIRGNDRTRAKVILREFAHAGLVPGEPLDARQIAVARKRLESLRYFVTDPQLGDPIKINITNRRSADRPYGEVAMPSLDDLVQARFQAPDDDPFPPLPPLPSDTEPLAPGNGPASVVPFGSGGAFSPLPDTIPPLEVPPPPVTVPENGLPPLPPGFGQDNGGSPRGTFPSLPGSNFSDVGPDLQEGFSNRSFSNIATQVEPGRPRRPFADIDIDVEEGQTGRILAGIGASSNGGLSGTFIIHERNFDITNFPRSFRELTNGQAFRGGGQEFRLELSPGTLINRVVGTFREPDLFNRRIGLNISGYAFSRQQPDFDESRGGGRFSVGKQLGTMAIADLALRVENVSINGFRTPAPAEFFAVNGRTFLTTLRPSIRFDNRSDPFLPTAGSYLELAYEQGFGDFTFPKLTVEARQHYTVWQRPDQTGKHILSLRGYFGISGRDTPLYERFFQGDFRSIRGFAYRGVGPHILGSNVGGVLTMLASAEYQFPLIASDNLQMVVFADSGTVENEYQFTDYRVSVGTGLRINIDALGPLPLAFDIAFPVVKGPDDRERIFNFYIGAFY